jgi:hypothetical protein
MQISIHLKIHVLVIATAMNVKIVSKTNSLLGNSAHIFLLTIICRQLFVALQNMIFPLHLHFLLILDIGIHSPLSLLYEAPL